MSIGWKQAMENSERDTLVKGVESFKAALEGMQANAAELDKYKEDAKVVTALREFRSTLLSMAKILEKI